MAGGFDLGALIPGSGDESAQQSNLGARMPSQSAAGGGTTWQDFVRKNQAGLASMGAQMMIGAPGGILSNLGAGLAKFDEGNALTEQENHARAAQQQALASKEAEGEANRASHERASKYTADTGAASREAVAELRGKYSADRAELALQKAQPSVALKYRTEARKIVEAGIGNLGVDDITRTKMIDEKANQMYQDDIARGRLKEPGAGTDVGAGANVTSAPREGGSKVGGPSEGGGQAGAGATGTPSKEYQDFLAKLNPAERARLDSDPKVREAVAAKYPAFKPYLSPEAKAAPAAKEPPKILRPSDSPIYNFLDKNRNPNSDYSTPGNVLP